MNLFAAGLSKNEKGYSLVEVMIYLSLLFVFITVALPIFQWLFSSASETGHHRLEQEAMLFFQLFEKEVREGQSYTIMGSQLLVSTPAGVYTYDHRDTIIRRQWNGQGHVVLAQYVQQVRYTVMGERLLQVNLFVRDRDGEKIRKFTRNVSLKVQGEHLIEDEYPVEGEHPIEDDILSEGKPDEGGEMLDQESDFEIEKDT